MWRGIIASLGGSVICLGSNGAPLGSPEPGRAPVAPGEWPALTATFLGNIIANGGEPQLPGN